jgi:hypothetical protein
MIPCAFAAAAVAIDNPSRSITVQPLVTRLGRTPAVPSLKSRSARDRIESRRRCHRSQVHVDADTSTS